MNEQEIKYENFKRSLERYLGDAAISVKDEDNNYLKNIQENFYSEVNALYNEIEKFRKTIDKENPIYEKIIELKYCLSNYIQMEKINKENVISEINELLPLFEELKAEKEN